MKLFKIITILLAICAIQACKTDKTNNLLPISAPKPIVENIEFGYNFNDYVVKRDTIKKGESFGEILERNNLAFSCSDYRVKMVVMCL